ncbi:MAG: DHHW family protein [Arenicellales bacterium]
MTLFYGLFLHKHFAIITLDIHLKTDHAGAIEVFTPSKQGGYTTEQSRRIHFPDASSGHRLALKTSNLSEPIRIDPTMRTGNVIIEKLIFKHLGFQNAIEGKAFDAVLLRCYQSDCTTTTEGLSIQASGNDAQIFFNHNVVPMRSIYWVLGFALLAGLIPLMLITLIHQRLKTTGALFQVASALSLGLGFAAYFGAIFSALVPAVLACITITVLLASLLLASKNASQSKQFSTQLSILITGLAFISIWPILSLSKDIHLKILKDINASGTKPYSWNESINSYKDQWDSNYGKFLYGAKQLINWDAKVKIFGLGFTPNSKTILGKDQWYFEGYGSRKVEKDIVRSIDNITDYMGLNPFTQSALAQWKTVLEERYYWLKEQGIDYVFALAPTKALVYPEKLPARISKLQNELAKQTRYTQLIDYLKENSIVPVVDLKQAMLSAKNKHPWPLFYRTDFHWNYLGSFYAYQAIAQTIANIYPRYNLEPLSIDDFRIQPEHHWAHHQFLKLAGLKPEEHQDDTYLKLFPNNADHYATNSDVYLKGIYDETVPRFERISVDWTPQFSMRTLRNPQADMDRILVIGDSFSEKMTPYFNAHAKTVYNYRTITQFSPEPIKYLQPQLVIQEVLNMYILDAPPSNAAEIKPARARYLKSIQQANRTAASPFSLNLSRRPL